MTSQHPGLRARNAQRTRAALIDAAVELCLTRGYENTTIEHIAAAGKVSRRTFFRYFAGKDAVFVAALDGPSEVVAAEMRSLPVDLGPLAAMRSALGTVLACVNRGGFHSLSEDRLLRIVRVVTASKQLQTVAIEYRGAQVVAEVADRMGLGIEDRRVELAMRLISVTVLHALGVAASSDVPLDSVVIGAQVGRAFAELVTYAADLDV